MTIKDLYIASNQAEQTVVAQIASDQWQLLMPQKITREPMTLETVVRYHTWDDAWIPDLVAGKTLEEIGDIHDHFLNLPTQELLANFRRNNDRGIAAVSELSDLDRTVRLSYGDFPLREYLQHNVSVRAFWSYDMARLIGADSTMPADHVEGLLREFRPVVESYRRTGMFPPALEVQGGVDPQAELLAMVGRE
jgi:hypothetical protein